MEKVGSKVLNIKDLLSEQIYTLGYFQRGYSWQRGHITDLLNDLLNEFRNQTENPSEQNSVYFLGSIIVSGEGEELSLVDGQQRLTSLSLILIWMAKEYEEMEDIILPLVFKEKDGNKICTLNVDERTPIMEALYNEEKIDMNEASISVRNIKDRFTEVERIFLGKRIEKEETFKFFEWLQNNVCVVQIKTTSEKDAYKIFESANDRGIKLTPVDMFKGYVLSKVNPDDMKEKLDGIWKDRMRDLKVAGESDLQAIRTWLRASQAKNSIDFESIGKGFHRWIKNKVQEDGTPLKESKDFETLIIKDFDFYMQWYLYINNISKKYDSNPGHEAIYCNQLYKYTFQHTIILTAIDVNDHESVVMRKIELVSTFIDIFIARRHWNNETVSQTILDRYMHLVIEGIRGASLKKMLSFLLNELEQQEENFYHFSVPRNKKARRIFLARFSAWLDMQMDESSSRLPEYASPRKYDIEHIIPNKYEQYKSTHEFSDEDEFKAYRDLFSALIILPKSFNRSFKDSPYEEKVKEYAKQNGILAKTLCSETYNKNPALRAINDNFKINFEPHDQFLKADIAKRQKVYTRLAQAIWDPDILKSKI